MSVLGALAHKAYWSQRGLSPEQITEQWSCGCSEAAWDHVGDTIARTVSAPADDRIRQLEAEAEQLREQLAKATQPQQATDTDEVYDLPVYPCCGGCGLDRERPCPPHHSPCGTEGCTANSPIATEASR